MTKTKKGTADFTDYTEKNKWRPFGQCFYKIPRLGCASLGMTTGDKTNIKN